jgi:methylglutaconyl-CoA hydratase
MIDRVVTLPAALDGTSVGELAASIESAMGDDTVRAVILSGSTETFCRGLDLDAIIAVGADEPDALRRAVDDFCRCLRALRFSDKPSVALVQGVAVGGGVGLAAACDLVLASDHATFALPEVLFGLAPAMILPFLLGRVSSQTAKLWAMTGLARNSQEALGAGLVDVVTSDADLAAESRKWLRMLRRGQRGSVKTVKYLCGAMPAMDINAALDLGHKTTLASLQDPLVVSAVLNFRQDGALPWDNR